MKTVTAKDVYQNLPRLETPRLVLRKAAIDDAPDVFVYSSDAEVTRYLRWGPHQSLTQTENYIKEVLDEYHEGREGPWMVELKPSHTVIGQIHLMDIRLQDSKAQVGFVLARVYWNKGIMTEALTEVLEYSFAGIRLNRLEGLCISENQAAARVLEKVGMTKQKELVEYQKGAVWNFSLYAMLREEFQRR